MKLLSQRTQHVFNTENQLMVTKNFSQSTLWKRNHGAVSKKHLGNSTVLQFEVPKSSSQVSLNLSNRIIEREDFKTGVVLWSWKDTCSWCTLLGQLLVWLVVISNLLSKGWFWAIKELKSFRDHDDAQFNAFVMIGHSSPARILFQNIQFVCTMKTKQVWQQAKTETAKKENWPKNRWW